MIIFTGKDTGGVQSIPVGPNTGTRRFVTGMIAETAMAAAMLTVIEDKLVLLR
jgi:hypothetical protein